MSDRTEIEDAYRKYGHSVFRRARNILGDDEEAMDVLQEVFSDLVRSPSAFAGRSSLSTWLYSATTHRCLNILRNLRTRRGLLRKHVEPHAVAATPAAGDATVAVRQLLARLPLEQGHAVVYYYLDEMSHREIAEVLKCSRRHVGDLLERAATALRTWEDCHVV